MYVILCRAAPEMAPTLIPYALFDSFNEYPKLRREGGLKGNLKYAERDLKIELGIASHSSAVADQVECTVHAKTAAIAATRVEELRAHVSAAKVPADIEFAQLQRCTAYQIFVKKFVDAKPRMDRSCQIAIKMCGQQRIMSDVWKRVRQHVDGNDVFGSCI